MLYAVLTLLYSKKIHLNPCLKISHFPLFEYILAIGCPLLLETVSSTLTVLLALNANTNQICYPNF